MWQEYVSSCESCQFSQQVDVKHYIGVPSLGHYNLVVFCTNCSLDDVGPCHWAISLWVEDSRCTSTLSPGFSCISRAFVSYHKFCVWASYINYYRVLPPWPGASSLSPLSHTQLYCLVDAHPSFSTSRGPSQNELKGTEPGWSLRYFMECKQHIRNQLIPLPLILS